MGAEEDAAVQKRISRLLTKSWKRLGKQSGAVDESGASETIHELRVTTRRLRELVEIGADAVPGSLRRVTIQKLRRARRLCAEIRNADVLMDLIAARTRRRTSEVDLWVPIQQEMTQRREAGLLPLRKSLSRLDLPELQGQWLKSVRRWGKETKGGSAAKTRRRLTKHLARRLKQFLRLRDQAKSPAAEIADVHRLRLAGKRLRYVLEAIVEIDGENLVPTLEHLRAFQARLGEWNDLDMLAEVLIDRCSTRSVIRSDPESAQRLLGVLRRIRESQERKLSEVVDLADDIPGLDEQFTSSR
jgi:CHAD domain-containing protein